VIPKPERVRLDGPAGVLEAVVEDPGVPGALCAIVCHPHPQFGGTMDNKVVTTLARALHECGAPTVRFNYRGVGASEGTYDEGRGETDDAMCAADFARTRFGDRALVVAGFSFGGMVALRVARQRACARLITVAPAITRLAPGEGMPNCPWLIVQGDADEVVAPQAVQTWAASLQPPPRVVMAAGVGHFFHGRLAELKEAVIADIRNG
jgi:alpha/beta superfamily hydrolase